MVEWHEGYEHDDQEDAYQWDVRRRDRRARIWILVSLIGFLAFALAMVWSRG